MPRKDRHEMPRTTRTAAANVVIAAIAVDAMASAVIAKAVMASKAVVAKVASVVVKVRASADRARKVMPIANHVRIKP